MKELDNTLFPCKIVDNCTKSHRFEIILAEGYEEIQMKKYSRLNFCQKLNISTRDSII